MLACVCTAQRRGFGYLLIVTGLEVVKGFSGYFGDFRIVFFVLIVAIFAVRTKLRPGTVLIGIAVGGTLLLMAIWWSAIKNEYRAFLDQGSSQQVVLVPFEDRIEFLLNKLVQVDGETIDDGFDAACQENWLCGFSRSDDAQRALQFAVSGRQANW